MNTVTLYTNPECTACYAANLRMRGSGIDFEVVNLAGDPAAKVYVRDQLGHHRAPVTAHTSPDGTVESSSGSQLDKINQLAAAQRASAAVSPDQAPVSVAVRDRVHWSAATPEVS